MENHEDTWQSKRQEFDNANRKDDVAEADA